MNKSTPRLPELRLKFYFLALSAFAAVTVFFEPWLAVGEAMVLAILLVYARRARSQQKDMIQQYISDMTTGMNTASRSTMLEAPIPMMAFRPDTHEVLWSNELFLKITGGRDHLFEVKLEDAVPQFSTQWLLEGKHECPTTVMVGSRHFRVYGSLSRPGKRQDQGLLATTYWLETTELDQLKARWADTRPVLAITMIDNYEELLKSGTEASRATLLAQLNERLNDWVAHSNGILQKYTRDRYLFLFEEQHYAKLQEEKFSVLDTVREVVSVDGVAATLSIGIGKDADSFDALFRQASLAIEMALSRGGDQVVVKDRQNFEFFGGRAAATEKRTKVKSRVMAHALGELISDVRQIYVMGHSYADMDALGSAVGICAIARKRGKRPQIVMDPEKHAVGPILRKLMELPEYEGVFITGQEAFLKAQAGALLVVVDTNRPEFVESPQLLEACNRVAVIDHHRRAASYIENAALNFHEPYASSTGELVTELLQYLIEPSDLLRTEAEALLAGIVLDTKNFTMRTGGRTFEAAAFLRRAGADPVVVQRLFQSDLQELVARYDIIRYAETVRPGVAVAAVDTPVDRVIAAKAADEMLTLKGIKGSFVLSPQGEGVYISARSLGELNVQVILETLGGGGTATMAGGQLASTSVDEARDRLLYAIDKYLEE